MAIKFTLQAISDFCDKLTLSGRINAAFAQDAQGAASLKNDWLFLNHSPIFRLPLRKRRRFSIKHYLKSPWVMAMTLVVALTFFGGKASAQINAFSPAALAAFSTTYGTASASQTTVISGSGLTLAGSVTITAPAGFEVSLTAGSGYASSINISYVGTTLANTTVYVRLAAASTVGSYSGNVVASQAGQTSQNCAIPNSTVSNAILTITGTNASGGTYGSVTIPSLTYTISGFVNGDNASSLYLTPSCSTTATTSSNAGSYPITPSGAAGPSYYTIVYVNGALTISPAAMTITATGPAESPGATPSGTYTNNFTYTGTVNGETVSSVTLKFNPTTMGAAGTTYVDTPKNALGPGTFLASNYTITYNPYTGTVENSYTWTGATNTTWSTGGNWSGGIAPGANDVAIIPNTVRAPTVTANATVNTISITGNNTITINSGISLTVNKSFSVPSGVSVTVSMAASSSLLTIGTGAASAANISNSGNFTVTGGHLKVNAGTNYINNASTGVFTANGGNWFEITGNGSSGNTAIYNAGTMIVGQSGSYCELMFDDSQSIMNLSSGKFYIGPTSYMTYFNTSAHDCTVTNSSGGTFVFQSDATGSAGIWAIPQGNRNSYVGSFTVQRYFSAYRGYRLLSSPIYAGTSGSNKVFSLNYLQNYAYISGDNAAGGFDKVQPGATIYLYNESKPVFNGAFIGGNYRSINDLSNGNSTPPTYGFDTDGTFSLPVSNGYLFFYRGNRNSSTYSQAQEFTTGTPAEAVTMSTSGSLNTGSFTFADWYNSGTGTLGYTSTQPVACKGFNLIGNPYPCNIDLNTYNTNAATSNTGLYVTSGKVSKYFYELNPKTQNYDTYDASGHIATNSASRYVMSGQGFFAQATAAGAVLILNETAKETTNAQNTGNNLFMGVPPSDPLAALQYIKVKMGMDSINTDETAIRFASDAKATYDINEDAVYHVGAGKLNLAAMSADNVALSINVLPFALKGQRIPLRVGATTSGNYTLALSDVKRVPMLFDIWLVDNNQKDSVNLRTTAAYAFSINKADSTTFGAKRFVLVTRQNPAFAYKLLDFFAKKHQDVREVDVTWDTKYEENYTNFTVEKSTDGGKTFNTLGGVAATGAGNYGITDQSPVLGMNLYRLKQEDINGQITYSAIVPVGFSGLSGSLAKNGVNIFPNPATGVVNMAVLNNFSASASYNFMITNATGKTLKQGASALPYWQYDVTNWQPGTYFVKIFDAKTQALVGTSKLVKL